MEVRFVKNITELLSGWLVLIKFDKVWFSTVLNSVFNIDTVVKHNFSQVRKTVISMNALLLMGFAIKHPTYPTIIYHWYTTLFWNVTEMDNMDLSTDNDKQIQHLLSFILLPFLMTILYIFTIVYILRPPIQYFNENSYTDFIIAYAKMIENVEYAWWKSRLCVLATLCVE